MKKEKIKYERVTFTWEGKRYERKGKTLAEAHAKAAALKESLKRGETGISGSMSVERWAYEWLDTYKRPKVGESTYKTYRRNIQKVIVPAIGSKPIKSITEIELQNILNSRTGKSKSDIDKLFITIRAIFKKAYTSTPRLINQNPAEGLEKPFASEGSRRSITEYEREKILTLADTHYAGVWIKLMLYCGLRPNETRALDWRHVDIENRRITIEVAMKARTRNIQKPKSDAGIRKVPIPAIFLPDLQAARGNPFSPVIVKKLSHKRHDESSMAMMWNNFNRELDISMGAKVYRNQIIIHAVADDLVPYCLRHTYCTDLEEKGVPINVASYLMGHANISVTAKIYTHTTEKTIQNAADLIDGISLNSAIAVAFN